MTSRCVYLPRHKSVAARGIQNLSIHHRNPHSKLHVYSFCGIQAALKKEIKLSIFINNKEMAGDDKFALRRACREIHLKLSL